MLKTSFKLVYTLPLISVDNNEFISICRKNRKLDKSNFIKFIHRIKDSSFPIFDIRQTFTLLRQLFIKTLIF